MRGSPVPARRGQRPVLVPDAPALSGSPDQPTVTRHGFGYSVFEHSEGGIHSELWIYVDVNAPVKFLVLKLRNDSGRARRLSATAYVEWVLGDQRAKSAPHVVTNADPGTGALFARNPYSTEFADRVAFLDADDMTGTVTGDRTEFLGRNGTLQRPAAMTPRATLWQAGGHARSLRRHPGSFRPVRGAGA